MNTKRFYGSIRECTSIGTLALLPTIRLTISNSVGLGFRWFQAWLHVWLWQTGRRSPDCTMLWFPPHVWLHWHRIYGAGVHVWFLHWRWHWWFWREKDAAR